MSKLDEFMETVTQKDLAALERLINERFTHLEKSTEIARQSMEKRLESMNEIRGALRDQGATAFTRSEHELYREKIAGEILMLRESKALLEGKASQISVNVTLAISILSLILAGAGVLLKLGGHP